MLLDSVHQVFTPLYVAYLLNKQTIMKTTSKTELLYKKDITLHLLLLNFIIRSPFFLFMVRHESSQDLQSGWCCTLIIGISLPW